MIEVLATAIHHTIEYDDFEISVIKGEDGKEHVVLVKGDIKNKDDILCRVSSECLPGTTLFSAECDCKQQIEYALKLISEKGQGIFIYLRQEGRGHGLAVKIRALANKNKGFDTFAAVESLGVPADIREYSLVKQILDLYQVRSIQCICNNPDKIQDLKDEGIVVNRVLNIPVEANVYSLPHLRAKQNRGHQIKLVKKDEI